MAGSLHLSGSQSFGPADEPDSGRVPASLTDRHVRDMRELSRLVSSPASGLVFFVGAGISAGAHRIPLTAELIRKLLETTIAAGPRLRDLIPHLPAMGKVGFEMVLNDLRQICPEAVSEFLNWLGGLDNAVRPNLAHSFLSAWVARGGSVITTNYDRLIERTGDCTVRFDRDAVDEAGFSRWVDDLEAGALFKVHGSLERPSSCLAALEQVGTTITGARRDLLLRVFRERPMCVVGWAGSDPDIPPLVRAALAERSPDLPLFWVQHSPDSWERVSPLLREASLARPIYAEADELFAALPSDDSAALRLAVSADDARPSQPPLDASRGCSPSGSSRFVGIALRRGGRERLALRVFDLGADQAAGLAEWAAARQERALTLWGSARGQPRRELAARRVVAGVVARLRQESAGRGELRGPLFGLLSMTISLSAHRRRLLVAIPGLLRSMRRSLAEARARGTDEVDVSIEEALTDLYEGRARLALAGGLVRHMPMFRDWILAPFERARSRVGSLPDRSLHAAFDVRVGYALAVATLGGCDKASVDVTELDRLSGLLSDERRRAHWKEQSAQLAALCPEHVDESQPSGPAAITR